MLLSHSIRKEKVPEYLLCDERIYYALAQGRSGGETALVGAVANHLMRKIRALVKSAKQEVPLHRDLQQNGSSVTCYSLN